MSLTALLKQRKPSPIPDRLNGKVQTCDVIIDTRASHHMTCDVSLLMDLKGIVSCLVQFVDGSQVMITKSGSLR